MHCIVITNEMRESYNNICTVEFYTFLPLSIGRTHLYLIRAWPQDESEQNAYNSDTGSHCSYCCINIHVYSNAQALTIEEGIQLLNLGPGRLEEAEQPEAAAQLRALAANLTGVNVGEIRPQCA